MPIGVETYAAFALRAWLDSGTAVSAHTRRYARRSAIGSLTLGMTGQVAYHLLTQAHAHQAPWAVTTAVACFPVLVLGMGTALAHLLRADSHSASPASTSRPAQTAAGPAHGHADRADDAISPILDSPMAAAATAAARELIAAGSRISRRTLRTAGLHGSNACLGALARHLTEVQETGWPAHQ